MGQYKSRPSRSMQDVWREEWIKTYAALIRKLAEDVQLAGDHASMWNIVTTSAANDNAEYNDAIDKKTADGLTPSHLACIHNDTHCLRWLLGKHVNLEHASKNMNAALHIAAFLGNVAAAALLLEGSAQTEAKCFQHGTALHIATLCRHKEMVQLLLEHGANVNAADQNGFTPLHLACHRGYRDIVEVLLGADADPCAVSVTGDRPLHIACYEKHHDCVVLLTQRVPSVELRDKELRTPLHYCAQVGNVESLAYLTQPPFSANVQTTDAYKDTPLHLACYHGQYDAVRFIVDRLHVRDFSLENVFSETVLHAAVTFGHSHELVLFLLRQPGVDINCQGRDGHTALHSACFHNNIRIAELLLEHGADFTLKTKDGESCCHWAYEKGYDQILELLRREAVNFMELLPSHVSEEMHASAPASAESTLSSQSALSGGSVSVPLPSPMGKIRHVTKEKANICQLRNLLPKDRVILHKDIHIIEPIASGSFGQIYTAEFGGRVVAVKRYKSGHFLSRSKVDLFCREVSLLAQVNHPNVIKFIGACLEQPSQFAIVTEYLSGGNLYTVLHVQKRSLDLVVKLQLMRDVSCGMQHLHNRPRPIIHRDLTSHNILLSARGEAVIADFGESGYLKRNPSVADCLTMQPGNLRWMAPEVFVQNTLYSEKADVFSMPTGFPSVFFPGLSNLKNVTVLPAGSVFMFTGSHLFLRSYGLCFNETISNQIPFEHLNPAAAAAEMAYHQKRPSIPRTCPKNIAALIHSTWLADADKRPAFDDILKSLDAILQEMTDHHAGVVAVASPTPQDIPSSSAVFSSTPTPMTSITTATLTSPVVTPLATTTAPILASSATAVAVTVAATATTGRPVPPAPPIPSVASVQTVRATMSGYVLDTMQTHRRNPAAK